MAQHPTSRQHHATTFKLLSRTVTITGSKKLRQCGTVEVTIVSAGRVGIVVIYSLPAHGTEWPIIVPLRKLLSLTRYRRNLPTDGAGNAPVTAVLVPHQVRHRCTPRSQVARCVAPNPLINRRPCSTIVRFQLQKCTNIHKHIRYKHVKMYTMHNVHCAVLLQ